MQLLENVLVERILDAFRNDQKVTALEVPWPATLAEKIALLRRPEVGRPVDRILNLAWGLYELDQAEFLSQVRPFWAPPGRLPYWWTLADMCAALQAGTFTLPPGNNVAHVQAAMRAGFRENDFVLIGYCLQQGIGLEEGHNRATAAVLVGVLPAKIKMYLGE
jgi:hypothetical protein